MTHTTVIEILFGCLDELNLKSCMKNPFGVTLYPERKRFDVSFAPFPLVIGSGFVGCENLSTIIEMATTV
jgi:hypothetical protein